jgi:hypothetical protein
VRLPPGRARLATRPAPTGSPIGLKTIGIVENRTVRPKRHRARHRESCDRRAAPQCGDRSTATLDPGFRTIKGLGEIVLQFQGTFLCKSPGPRLGFLFGPEAGKDLPHPVGNRHTLSSGGLGFQQPDREVSTSTMGRTLARARSSWCHLLSPARLKDVRIIAVRAGVADTSGWMLIPEQVGH